MRCSTKLIAWSVFCAYIAVCTAFCTPHPDPPVARAEGHVVAISEATTADGDDCYYPVIGFVANRDYVTFEDYCTSPPPREGTAFDVVYDPKSPASTAEVDRRVELPIVPIAFALLALGALVAAFLYPDLDDGGGEDSDA